MPLRLRPLVLVGLAVVFVGTATGLSPAADAATAWSEAAIQLAKDLTVSQREKLLSEDHDGDVVIARSRNVRIVAERYDPTKAKDWTTLQLNQRGESDTAVATKIVHFQRHGQGYHNLLGDVLRAAGLKPSVDSRDPTINPWLRPEIVDAPLTETGKDECRNQRAVSSLLRPELVVVSPLHRAIQTAQISFGHVYGEHSYKRVPWIAHEGCREELGVLVCNKRRPLSLIQADFPDIEFHGNMPEEDTLWHPTERESGVSKSNRIYDFLVNFVAQRPESEIAVVSHSATLFHMCNAVLDCGDDLNLASWFLTSEIRSMKLTFHINKDYSESS
mmetsp:Transcript_2450/g.4001  ORF Transcript_2450/g.4001 Transcript_2450/m.4001 type:complete len:331 (+) Transcript_2450:93-1085(+)|eukprot:CAMPEP_0178753762 /NCGR_PEP_ID=MMETSP0744-20121128/11787_1 /TAXON_ID=913974 /ORGANISM="Nitzschia punctata, Strain CCMP561" /LENGTH=330 /DNA_ID=CAMNT_0020407605 /DNA_START=67 /DNA_END=1059 /DNA_ORIENTATION=-